MQVAVYTCMCMYAAHRQEVVDINLLRSGTLQKNKLLINQSCVYGYTCVHKGGRREGRERGSSEKEISTEQEQG